MGIRDNLGDFEGEIRNHSDSIDTRLGAAMRARPAAATAISGLLREAIDILSPYTYGPPALGPARFGQIEYSEVRFWGLPIVVADRDGTLRPERRGRGWCIGNWSASGTTILGDDGSITYATVKRLAAPDPYTPQVQPRYGIFGPSAAEKARWKKGADGRKRSAETAAAQDAEWQQLRRLGLQTGDLYFEVLPGSAPMMRPDPDQLHLFTYEGWERHDDRGRVWGRDCAFFETGFSDAVRANQYQRNKKDPAGYGFVSDSPKLRVQVPQRGGLSFGVFDDGMPVLVHYNKGGSTGLSSIPEVLYAWNLEKTLTQRIQCIFEEFSSIQR
ncbi:hypothetical protein [Nocardia salmonicida]|uniref:hypothetical protein n=1 Tax=Nocardia salmonicida TaxID=53431 RepID=UPI0033F862ED